MQESTNVIHFIARGVEFTGIGIIVLGLLFALGNFVVGFRQNSAYARLRQQVGKAILLGLEVLVAADIILTVTTEPTLQNVAVLGIVVLIRTFLSFSLEVELEGRWPWQPSRDAGDQDRRATGKGVMGGND